MYGVENRNSVYEYSRKRKAEGDREAMSCRKILSSGNGTRKWRVMPVAAARMKATTFFELRSLRIMLSSVAFA